MRGLDGRTSRGGRLASAIMLWLLAGSGVFAISSHASRADGFEEGQDASTVVGQANFTSASNVTSESTLYMPFRPEFDQNGDLWVADENQNRVLEFKPPFTDGMSASIVLGQESFTSDDYAASQSGMHSPVALAFDSRGDLWVADYVNNRILEFEPPFATGMNASLELGQPAGPLEFQTNGTALSPGGFYAPLALAFDSSGNLWVVDRVHDRVLEFKPPFADGMNASSVIGQPSLDSDIGGTSMYQLLFPESLAFDPSGNLWVVDESNNRVLEYASTSLGQNQPPAILEIGQPAGTDQFNQSAKADSQNGFDAPVGIAFDGAGNLWVSDRINNRVLEFNSPFADGMDAALVLGQSGSEPFETGGSATTQTGLSNPLGLAFDKAGNLWVADQLNNRVLEFGSAATATTQPKPSGVNAELVAVVALAFVAALGAAVVFKRRKVTG